MDRKKENKFGYVGRIAWLYTKYQILTKLIFLLVIFPGFKWLLHQLLLNSGRESISSGDYVSFLLSFQGLGLLIISCILLMILIGTDINAFIIMSALIYEKKINLKARSLLVASIKSLKSFMKPGGLLIAVYIALVIPLMGIGFGVSATSKFQIPNFITGVIFTNKLYTGLYVLAIIIFWIITLKYIFFFQYLLILNQHLMEALKNASNLMKKHWKGFIKGFILHLLGLTVVLMGSFLLLYFISFVLASLLPNDLTTTRIWTIFVSITMAEIMFYLTIMILPIVCSRLTYLFYKFNAADGIKVNTNLNLKAEAIGDTIFQKIHIKTKVKVSLFILAVLVLNLMASSAMGIYFDDIFRDKRKIDIIAHRGGGDLGAENSILGLKNAIAQGANYSEIDVQRTKDDKYVINHDPTFNRVAGVSKESFNMTYEEIKKLKIIDSFNENGQPQDVATLEQFLDEAKGKIGLFIELKGATADERMVDDVVAMVKNKNMEKEVALLSLDYSLIKYIEDKYPKMKTGFLYFFSLGNTKKLEGDILIMEEAEATPSKVLEIKEAGKEAIVWTVNSQESIDRFVNSDVDGIITDHVKDVKEGIKRRDNRSDIDIILDELID